MPAISRAYSDADNEVVVRSVSFDTVSFTRGLGDSGYRLEVVEHKCPHCGFDRLFRQHRVLPEEPDHVQYWCLNPTCKHFVGETFSYAGERNATMPTESDYEADVAGD